VRFQHAIELDLPPEGIFAFFADLETWFRLNPQWQVLSFQGEPESREGGAFVLEVEYDRSEQKVVYQGLVTALKPGRSLSLCLEGEEPREITIEVLPTSTVSLLKYREDSEHPLSAKDQMELNLWLKSVANYILISHRTSPFSWAWKWFLDRYWLKMSPSGRRTVFFVVAAEGLSLVFFLLILVWLLLFKRV
jgi:hypothetical protein